MSCVRLLLISLCHSWEYMIFTFKKRFDSVIHSESPSSSWGPSILFRVISGQA